MISMMYLKKVMLFTNESKVHKNWHNINSKEVFVS